MTNIGFVVLHYLYGDLTETCLDSLNCYAPGRPVVVVDNGSPEPFQGSGRIHRLTDNRCLAAAMNAGTRVLVGESAVDVIVQLNNDIQFTATSLPALQWAFAHYARLGIASFMMDQQDADFAYYACPHPPGPTADAYLRDTLPQPTLQVLPFVDNAAFAIRRSVWNCIGPLEERFSGASWGANYDYCWRARAAGWQVGLLKSGFVFHRHRATWSRLDPDYFAKSVHRMMTEAEAIWGQRARQVLWRDPSWRQVFLTEDPMALVPDPTLPNRLPPTQGD